jgi:hypothetical protein
MSKSVPAARQGIHSIPCHRMGGLSCGRTKLGGYYYIERLALSRPQGRRIESEVGFEEIALDFLMSSKPVSGPRVSAEGLTGYFRTADDPGVTGDHSAARVQNWADRSI